MATKHRRRYFKELRFQQLQGFCETARARSFAVAAVRLGLSRPALWQQVRELERLLGADLVRRHGRGVELTDDGHALLELAEPLVAGFASLPSAFADRRKIVPRRLVVVSAASLLADELKSPIREFRRRNAEVQLTLIDRNSPEALRMIESGEADLAVAGYFADEPLNPLLEYEPLFQDRLVLVCPRGHELTQRRTMRLETLVRYPFVLMAQDTITRRRVDRVFESHGLLQQLNVVLDATNYSLVLDSVALGLGISIVAAGPQRDFGRRLHVHPLNRSFGIETTALIRKKGIPAASHVRAFEDLVRRSRSRIISSSAQTERRNTLTGFVSGLR
jgi:DNA-binding transcriptional LysR family regulator